MSPQPHRKISGTRAVAAKNTPTAESRAKARHNSGAVAHQRKQQPQTPAQRWAAEVDGVLERFKADMRLRYEGEEPSRDETE